MENRIKDEIECVQSTFPETTIVVETYATKQQHSDNNDSSNDNKTVTFSLPLASLLFNDEDEGIQLIKGGKVVFTLSASHDSNGNEKKKDIMSVTSEFCGNVPEEIPLATENRNIMTEIHNNDNNDEEDEEDQLVLMEIFRIQQIVQDFIASSSSLITNENKANSKSQVRTVNDKLDCSSSSGLLDNERFCEGLRECGFVQCGHNDDLWVERTGGRGVTIEKDNDQPSIGGVWVSCDGLNPQDVADFLRLMFERKGDDNEVEYDTWPKQILQWARANVGDGFEEDVTDDQEEDLIGNELYNSAEIETLYLNPELKVLANPNRELKISTWGRALMKSAPTGAVNFNAAVLSGRGHGVNTRKMNGLCLEVQTAVSKCSLFPTWMEIVIRKIERDDLSHIAVNCTKGRHRSVAAAELLKKLYYRRADIHHLTIV